MNPISSKLEKSICFDIELDIPSNKKNILILLPDMATLAQFTLHINGRHLPKVQYFDFKIDGLNKEYRWSINQKNILTLSKNWDDQVVQSEEFDLSEVDNTPKISELFKSKEKVVKLFIKPVDKEEQKNN